MKPEAERRFFVLRELQSSELGWFAEVRRQRRETGRQRGINFNSSIIRKLFPKGIAGESITIVSRRHSDELVTQRPLKRQQKNWRLVGDQVEGENLDSVYAGDYFWALITIGASQPVRMTWDVVCRQQEPKRHESLRKLCATALPQRMEAWEAAHPLALQLQEAVGFLAKDSSPRPEGDYDGTALKLPAAADDRRKVRKSIRQAFKPRARLLQLLGDQLIGSPRLAVFELVKNAYDADASSVKISLSGLGTNEGTITVLDDGHGMSLQILRDVWLVPGDDYREQQRAQQVRSRKYRRLPLGEKGVGRFAVHKLGDQILLTTRARKQKECVVRIDWRELLKSHFLDEARVKVTERRARIFKAPATGTQIQISALRESNWTRRDVRELHRQVTSISSPFGRRSDKFRVSLEVPDHPEWIANLPDAELLLRRAPWRFKFKFDGGKLSYSYRFRGVPGIKVAARKLKQSQPLQILADLEPDDLDPTEGPRRKKQVKLIADKETLEGIGPVEGEFYVFDRDREVLSKLADSRLIERYLDQNGGVRVYRDGIRVYNYGENGDDWLGLDLRRVNTPTRNISRNIIVGVVDLKLEASPDLREKTNREGFVENEAYRRLRQVVLGALSVFEVERRLDKQRLREATGKPTDSPKGVETPIAEIRRIAKQNGIGDQIEHALTRIEADYNTLRDNFLRAGLSQVGLAVVFHEIERGVAVLHKSIQGGQSIDLLKAQAGQLLRILETSTQLLKKADKKQNSLRHLVRTVRDLNQVRFRLHQVRLVCPALEENAPDAESIFAFSLALGALTNLVDNAIHWMRVARPDDAPKAEARRLFIDIVPDFPDGPAVVIADNGTGFSDVPQQLIQPFFSRRPDGMGLGLYYANLVMQLNEGLLMFPGPDEFELPPGFDGAVIALVFKKV